MSYTIVGRLLTVHCLLTAIFRTTPPRVVIMNYCFAPTAVVDLLWSFAFLNVATVVVIKWIFVKNLYQKNKLRSYGALLTVQCKLLH